MIYAQLDIWRSTAASFAAEAAKQASSAASTSQASMEQQQQQQQPQEGPSHRPVQKEDSFDISYVLQMLDNKDESSAAIAAAAATSASSFIPTSVPVTSSLPSMYSATQVASAQQHSALSPPPPPYPSFDQVAANIKREYASSEPMDEDDDEGELTRHLFTVLHYMWANLSVMTAHIAGVVQTLLSSPSLLNILRNEAALASSLSFFA